VPNMRLKLPGALVGRIALPRRLAFLSAPPPPCARGRCARSFMAASFALGAEEDNALVYSVGIGFQILAVGSVTALLSLAERTGSQPWARTHAWQASLLYLATVALILLWPNAGHGSGVVRFMAFLAATGVAANAGVLLLAERRRRKVAA